MFEEHERGDGGASGGGEGDTIPKPVGLAEAATMANPDRDRAEIEQGRTAFGAVR